jgi:Family of unknown function (DUF5719)
MTRSADLMRYLPAAIVLAGLGAIGGTAAMVKPGPAGTSPSLTLTRQVAINGAIRACPPGASGSQDRIALYSAQAQPAATSTSTGAGVGMTGQATLAALPQSGVQAVSARQASASAPAALALLQVPATAHANRQQAWSVTATGLMAPGMEAELANSAGLAEVRCGEPGSDLWFAGPGQQNGAGQVQLDLMNVDSLAATVDVTVITDAGPVDVGNGTGIAVPAHQLVTESLSAASSGASVVAIEVRTSAGRVAAAVWESQSRGAASWLPASAAPATRMVIPGVPPSGTAGALCLVVPGSTDARVSVTAITPQGTYRPFGTQTVDLPAQSASYVQLTPLGGTAVALELSANVPVTASVVVPGSGIGAFTAATAPVSQQAVIAGNVSGGGMTADVVLTAPGRAVRVELTETGAGGQSSSLVSVPAGRTLIVPAKAPPGSHKGQFTIVITPEAGSGLLYAARVETQGQAGAVLSIVPAVSARTMISLPPVRDAYTAIQP